MSGIAIQKILKVRLTLMEELLGTAPSDEEIYASYIASNAPEGKSIEDEIATLGVEGVIEKGKTIFNKAADGKPFLFDYHIKGFFKDSCGMLGRVAGKDENGKKKKGVNESSNISAYKKIIDGLIFVFPRQIIINVNGDIGSCQRPLRGQTAQGEVVALANSEAIPAGSTLEFEIHCLSLDHYKAVIEWLDYGQYRGLGQWRNSGKGRFTYEILSET